MDEAFYFENTKDGHNKFWAVTMETKNNKHYVIRRYGKIGQEGKTMVEDFVYRYQAEKKRNALIQEKLNKGYKPVV